MGAPYLPSFGRCGIPQLPILPLSNRKSKIVNYYPFSASSASRAPSNCFFCSALTFG